MTKKKSISLGLLIGTAALISVLAGSLPASALDLHQNPDGSYPSLGDFVNDIEGTPCGIDCTADAEKRWCDWY